MPIKPENKSLYPSNWSEIVAEIRERSGNCCEGSPAYPDCRVPNRAWRVNSTGEWTMNWDEALAMSGSKDTVTLIVLTTAHLDHDPTNNGEPGNRPNLLHLCQRCHLTYDARHHAETARKTRHDRRALRDLFDTE